MLMDETELVFTPMEYEKRIVVFYDILGWKTELERAGNDPKKIARLAAAVRTFAMHVHVNQNEDIGARMSTFSDNVVYSIPYDPDRIGHTIQSLGVVQFGIAMMGFWIRGAITVGDLHHDADVVFGPALVRAYHLESKIAVYPRILIDIEADELKGGWAHVLTEDQTFIDPFTADFYDSLSGTVPIAHTMIDVFNGLTGSTVPTKPVYIPGDLILKTMLNRVYMEIINAPDLSTFEKHEWLFDRIAPRTGATITGLQFLPESLMSAWAEKKADAEVGS